MTYDRVQLKSRAKLASDSAANAKLVTLVYLIITYVLQLLYSRIIGDRMYEMMEAVSYGYFTPVDIPGIAVVLGLLVSLMLTFIGIGYESYALIISRGGSGSYSNLFDGFMRFCRFVWLHILMYVFIYLWTLLLIIPGIIASYRYRMAVFILLDDPDCTALEAIRRSKQLMQGHKMELFVLDLSFIGWELLCGLTFGILYVWKLPYMRCTYAIFYSDLIGYDPEAEYIPETRDDNDSPPWEL